MTVAEFSPRLMCEVIDRKRDASGLTWNQTAGQIGVCPATLSRMRHGGQPNVDTVVKVGRWLGSMDIGPYLLRL